MNKEAPGKEPFVGITMADIILTRAKNTLSSLPLEHGAYFDTSWEIAKQALTYYPKASGKLVHVGLAHHVLKRAQKLVPSDDKLASTNQQIDSLLPHLDRRINESLELPKLENAIVTTSLVLAENYLNLSEQTRPHIGKEDLEHRLTQSPFETIIGGAASDIQAVIDAINFAMKK